MLPILKRKIPPSKLIPAQTYSESYLLSDYLEGYQEFKRGELSYVKTKLLNMLVLERGTTMLEVGFGRGEFILHCARRGARVTGIDYSAAALRIARKTLHEFPAIRLVLGDCRNIPFARDSFDRLFAGDVIEHLCYKDGVTMVREMYRVLKPGGFMFIHTAPNYVFSKIIYPLARPFLKLINGSIAGALDDHMKMGLISHPYEYSSLSLRRLARETALISPQIWIDKDILRSGQHRFTNVFNKNPLINFIGSCGKFPAVRLLLGNDLYLKCYKT